MFQRIRDDIRIVFERDPAARARRSSTAYLSRACMRSGFIGYRTGCGTGA